MPRAKSLSVIVASRNEEFLERTILDVLENAVGDTEVIAVLDGYMPSPMISERKGLVIIHNQTAMGQRAAVNKGVRESKAKYVMKLDAHCAVDKGFDVKLMEDMEPNWTVVPRMYNFHVYDWICECGKRKYQGSKLECCGNVTKDFKWKRKRGAHDFMLFDAKMNFKYWREFEGWHEYKKRPENKGEICEQLSAIGACWFIYRDRYWELEGLDEKHGGWGQVGTEVACKSWLSGGKQMVNKKTWFAHMFRTGNFKGTGHGGTTFPYPLSGSEVQKAKKYSRDLWLNDKWPGAIHPLSWLIERFAPVPGWGNDK